MNSLSFSALLSKGRVGSSAVVADSLERPLKDGCGRISGDLLCPSG